MNKKILLGTENFDELILENGYYVDKTELIYDLVEETGNKVSLFTRPRRFGKTLTMKMLESFFDIRRDSQNIFSGLSVMNKHPEFCAEWMNHYPVLFISLKDVDALTFDKAYEMLVGEISKLCIKHSSLETADNVDSADSLLFHRLKFKEANTEEIKNAFQTIMRMMNAVYASPVVLLIDEYDVPLAKAHANGFYREMLDLIRGLMSTSLKTNDHLKFAVITGCLRIPKESIFTGVNNFASYSVLDDDFSQYFGFTQCEIEALLRYYDREEKIALTQAWYDGYVFGDSRIYCPWDVMSYVSALRKRKDAKPKAYWENTSGNDTISAFFDPGNESLIDQFESLLNGGTIIANVTNALTYEDAYKSESNLWSVLLMTGYVTAITQEDSDHEEGSRQVELRIPNREIVYLFQNTVVDRFNCTVDQHRIDDLMQALWNGEEEKASRILSDLLFETISYMDYHEDYYHAFIAGIFTGRGFLPDSNKEQGLGRPDVIVHDRKNRRAIIIETKKSDSQSRLEYWCDKAIQQIVDREYARNMDGYNLILCYGIAFFEKTAMVKRMMPPT